MLGIANQDRSGSRSEAEVVIQSSSATRELVATSSTPSTIAETDVVGRAQALGTRDVEACSTTVVGDTVTSAYVISTLIAMHDHGVQYVPTSEVLFQGFSNVCDVGISGGEPVHKLIVANSVDNL